MKSFFGSTYISKDLLEDNHINHPIRLEYYKVEKEIQNKVFYGIEVVKTEYQKEKTNVENKEIENVTNYEEEIIEVLEKFKLASVTPSSLEYTLKEYLQTEEELCC